MKSTIQSVLPFIHHPSINETIYLSASHVSMRLHVTINFNEQSGMLLLLSCKKMANC